MVSAIYDKAICIPSAISVSREEREEDKLYPRPNPRHEGVAMLAQADSPGLEDS